jgi:hypothetical protein
MRRRTRQENRIASTLRRRLAGSEKATPECLQALRSHTCRAINTRVVTIDADETETWEAPTPPAECPNCRRRPALVGIIEVDDWERVRRPGGLRRGDICPVSGVSNVPAGSPVDRRRI